MWQLKIIYYFNIYEYIIRYRLKFITTLYEIINFSRRLFFLHRVFHT